MLDFNHVSEEINDEDKKELMKYYTSKKGVFIYRKAYNQYKLKEIGLKSVIVISSLFSAGIAYVILQACRPVLKEYKERTIERKITVKRFTLIT